MRFARCEGRPPCPARPPHLQPLRPVVGAGLQQQFLQGDGCHKLLFLYPLGHHVCQLDCTQGKARITECG